MKLIHQDLWTVEADYICVTTNGFVKDNGNAVMGRGCALEATQRFPGIERDLGHSISTYGNHVSILHRTGSQIILSFPVKHRWWDKADLLLIAQSCEELKHFLAVTGQPKASVVIPRPGCGNGQLDWNTEVFPVLTRYFWNSSNILVTHK